MQDSICRIDILISSMLILQGGHCCIVIKPIVKNCQNLAKKVFPLAFLNVYAIVLTVYKNLMQRENIMSVNVKSNYKAALDLHKKWFLESSVMPLDGKLGIAERVLLTANNTAAEKAMSSFPAWRIFENGCILEQRRADCCFETAYYFLRRYQIFNEPHDREICSNMLNYLYCRSGMLSRNPNTTTCDLGVWNWSDIRWTPAIWFDDNAWCIMLALAIAEADAEFDKKYDMKKHALEGAAAIAAGFERQWPKDYKYDPSSGKMPWAGNLALPHWGALAACALSCAMNEEKDEELLQRYRNIDKTYFDFITAELDNLNFSELSYSLLYLGWSQKYHLSQEKKNLGIKIRQKLLDNCDKTSLSLPSTHYEAPNGAALADLIYTMNWFYTAMTVFEQKFPSEAGSKWLADFSEFLIRIQDKSAQAELAGCWRGMYDIDNASWGGGDCYEGGANSIYTGWTNAPLGWSLLDCSVMFK